MSEEAEPEDEDASQEEEPEETIEDLFSGEGSEDDGEEQDDDEVEDGDDAGDGGDDDEEEGGTDDSGEEAEDEDDGEDPDADDEGSTEDDPAGVPVEEASGIQGNLLDVDDRTEAPEFGGAGADVGRLSTGIDMLDERLDGGIPPGRILSFVAMADTQSELLVKHLAAQHDCLYLSTLRPKWEVEEEVTDFVQKSATTTGETDVHIEQLTPDSRLDSARRHVEKLEGRSIVVIDSANELEAREKERYVYFMDELKRKLWETGSVGLFYCIEEAQPPDGRDVTLRRADLIWQLRSADDPDELRHRLVISKFRGGRAQTTPLKLALTDEVEVEAVPDGA